MSSGVDLYAWFDVYLARGEEIPLRCIDRSICFFIDVVVVRERERSRVFVGEDVIPIV